MRDLSGGRKHIIRDGALQRIGEPQFPDPASTSKGNFVPGKLPSPFLGGFGERARMYQVSDVVNSCPDLLFPIISEGSCSVTVCVWSHSSIARRYKVTARTAVLHPLKCSPLSFKEDTTQPQSWVWFYPSNIARCSERLKPRGQTLPQGFLPRGAMEQDPEVLPSSPRGFSPCRPAPSLLPLPLPPWYRSPNALQALALMQW